MADEEDQEDPMTDPEVKALDETRLALLRKTGSADVQDVIATLDETRAQLAEEQTAHAMLRALWDARCGTIASVQARLEEARAQLVEARDWSRMTPREAWEHLRAAPKVAGPWTLGERREARGMRIVASETDRGVFVDACSWTVSNRVEADALLRDAGWLLVDDEGG